MGNDIFDVKILTEKLSKLNNSQQSIESLSQYCVSNRKKARQIVETWEKKFNSSHKEQCISFLYLANDILQNSRRKGSEFVNEFWKVLPAALKHVYDKGDESGKKAATRLVDIWEERKVFGSRVQSLKDELEADQVKGPTAQAVSNKMSTNPIKVVKKDANSLRIKLALGGFAEKIVSAFHSLHEECSNEESALETCSDALLSVERMVKEVEHTISQGCQPETGIADEMQEQTNLLQQCVRQLEGAEAIRMTLITLLKDALQDQEEKLGTLQSQLQVARSRIDEVGIVRPKILSHNHALPAASVGLLPESQTMGELSKRSALVTGGLQMPPSQIVSAHTIPAHQIHQPSSQPTTSFASLAATDEDSKKAAAAAVAAKLAASTSSAQMFSSVLSSFVAEEAASMNDSLRKAGFPSSLPMFPPEKRQKLEQSLSSVEVTNHDSGSSGYFTPLQPLIPNNSVSRGSVQSAVGPPPPPSVMPPNSASNQFVQSAGMQLNVMPYGFGGNGLPLPPPPPSHLMGLSQLPTQPNTLPLQPPQQPIQQHNASGGYYRPPGIGPYGSSNQTSTPPMQRQ